MARCRPKSIRTPANSAFTYSYQSNADGDTLDAADLVRTINRYQTASFDHSPQKSPENTPPPTAMTSPED